jgi:hypothetical protein
MSDNSLPYLVDVSLTSVSASYDKSNDPVVIFTARWTVGAAQPDSVEIYRQFGSGDGLFDLNNRIKSLPSNPSLVTLSIADSNRDTALWLGVAPRIVVDGVLANQMPDASGDLQMWDQFALEGYFPLSFPPAPGGGSGIAPPDIQASSIAKTLTSNDHIDVTVIPTISPTHEFHIIVNTNGNDEPQQDSDQPSFSFRSAPGVSYAIKAQQKGVNFNGDPWSAWCTPVVVVANQRVRSLRLFLGNSGVLLPGTRVRQYAQNNRGSTGSMMGL